MLGAHVGALAETLGVKILSPEYELLLNLYNLGSLTATELQLRSSASSTTFYAKLKLVAQIGLVQLDRCTADRRISLYALTPETRRIIDERLRIMHAWAAAKVERPEAHTVPFDWHLARLSNLLDMQLLSPEFSVIMNIYDCEPIPASELFYKTRLSNSRFYTAVTLLTARRTIRSLIDPTDRRRRIYRLPRRVRSQLDQSMREFRLIRPLPVVA